MSNPRFAIGSVPEFDCVFNDESTGTFLDLTGIDTAKSYLCLLSSDGTTEFKGLLNSSAVTMPADLMDGNIILLTKNLTNFTNLDEAGKWTIGFRLEYTAGAVIISEQHTEFAVQVIVAVDCA